MGEKTETAVTYRGTIYPWHCDHMGHLNVVGYVGKFDEATWNFFASIGITPNYLRDHKRGMVATEQRILYKKELIAGDVVIVKTRLIDIRKVAIHFEHEMRNAVTLEVSATCELTGAHIDLTSRKPRPFPENLLASADGLLERGGLKTAGPRPGPRR